MDQRPHSSSTLSYAPPKQPAQDAGKGTLLAALLVAPGIAGLCLLAGALAFDARLAWKIGPAVGLCVWAVAFICAIVSIYLFQRKPQPPWVMICVVFNMIGVIFTLSPIGLWLAAMLWMTIFRSSQS